MTWIMRGGAERLVGFAGNRFRSTVAPLNRPAAVLHSCRKAVARAGVLSAVYDRWKRPSIRWPCIMREREGGCAAVSALRCLDCERVRSTRAEAIESTEANLSIDSTNECVAAVGSAPREPPHAHAKAHTWSASESQRMRVRRRRRESRAVVDCPRRNYEHRSRARAPRGWVFMVGACFLFILGLKKQSSWLYQSYTVVFLIYMVLSMSKSHPHLPSRVVAQSPSERSPQQINACPQTGAWTGPPAPAG